ncbi:SMP-30/gluconolactonase/LRE family protein [Devosia sp. ZW T5_3]|uniref:SMP-30/gluconolactonase/LRE family protein n=1 Tax=Devosia sp. ZW T5_3 TaxID=3378085 RepID=UPI003853AD23
MKGGIVEAQWQPVFEKVARVQCRVGESPVWDPGSRTLSWCDIHAGKVYALDTCGGGLRQWTLPERIGSLAVADDGRYLVALVSGVHFFDPESERLTFLVNPERDGEIVAGDRLNDSKVGPDGAYWVGSIHQDGRSAALYRVTSDGTFETKVSGMGTVNGLAFSMDGATLYVSDSKQCWIDRFDLDPSDGTLRNRRRIASPGEEVGRPDGAATDEAGRYWSAGVSAGCLNCFSDEGVLLQSISVPVKRPTMPCFGGEDMRTLYFTSIRRPDDASDDCGDVFSMRVDVPGVRIAKFRTS